MKLVFTGKRNVRGIKILAFDVEADKKAKNVIKSNATHWTGGKENNVLIDEPKIKMIRGKKYLDC